MNHMLFLEHIFTIVLTERSISDWFFEYYREVDENNRIRKKVRKVRFRYDENYIVKGKEYKTEDDESKVMNLLLEAEGYVSNNYYYSEASDLAEEVLTIDSSNPDAWNIKGLAYKHFEQYDESKKCFDKSIKYGGSQAVRDNKAYMIKKWVNTLDFESLSDLNKAITLLDEAIDEIDYEDSQEWSEDYFTLKTKFQDQLEKIEELMKYPKEDLVTITGTQFYDIDFRLKKGRNLELRKEPYNSHDHDAIAVYHDDKKIGYVANKDHTAYKLTTQASQVDIPNNIGAEFLLSIGRFYIGRIKREKPAERKKTLMGFKIIKDKKEYNEIMEEIMELIKKDGYEIEVDFRKYGEDISDKGLDEIKGHTKNRMDDNLAYFLEFNEKFIKNMSKDFFEKIVEFPHAIPIDFKIVFEKYNHQLWKERSNFLDDHEEINEEMTRLRYIEREIAEYEDLHSNLYIHIEFLKKYPEFKQLISHVEICMFDDDENVILGEISLDDFIENVYYNPYLNEKKHLLRYGFE